MWNFVGSGSSLRIFWMIYIEWFEGNKRLSDEETHSTWKGKFVKLDLFDCFFSFGTTWGLLPIPNYCRNW